MSTRATYTFAANGNHPAVTLYVHHDGYLEGAAEKFKDACLFPNERGGMFERFLRANDGAELTGTHDTHGDTEYRYTLTKDNQLTAEHRSFSDSHAFGNNNWRGVWTGSLLDFIEVYGSVKLLALPGKWLDINGANALLLERIECVNHQIKQGWTGNASSTAGDAWVLLKEIEKRFGNSKLIQQAIKCIDSADVYFAGAFGWADQMKIDEVEAVVRWQASFREGRERLIAEYIELA